MATAVPAATRNIDLWVILMAIVRRPLLLDELTAHDTTRVRLGVDIEIVASGIVDDLRRLGRRHGLIQPGERGGTIGQRDLPRGDARGHQDWSCQAARCS